MSYFFRYIDTFVPFEKKTEKSLRKDVIYNLDEFHTINRVGNRITASRSNNTSVIIAICKTEVGAAYIMDCIYDKIPVNLHDLNKKETVSEWPSF